MDKLQIVNELLKNTFNPLKELLVEYIAMFEDIQNKNVGIVSDELMMLDICISYIQTENFDIKNWGLFEIPIYYIYCFRNRKTEQLFDLAVEYDGEDGKATPQYVDVNSNTPNANSIQEAIEKYDVFIPEATRMLSDIITKRHSETF